MKQYGLPLIATLAYALAGAGWIIAGYFLSSAFYDQPDTSVFELYKGLAFVTITAAVLFFVLRHMDVRSIPEASIVDLAAEFRESIRNGERVARRLPVQMAVIVVVLLGLLLLGLAWVRENALKTGEQSAMALHHTVAAQIGGSLRLVDVTLAQLARDLAATQATAAEPGLALSRLSGAARTLSVVDAHGRMTHNTDGRAPGGDFSGRDYFRHHRDHAQSGFFISNPQRSVFTNTWFIAASHAVRGPAGEFRGVVLAVLELEHFGRYWQLPAFGKDLSVTLFRNDGTLLMRSPHS